MPNREPSVPRTQTSAPVSDEPVRDAAHPDRRRVEPEQPSDRSSSAGEDAAGGDRAIAEYD